MSTESVARADVLAALARRGSYASDVRLWCNILADTAVAVKAGEDGVAVGWTYPHRDLREVVAWTVESPAHGVEKLNEAGLWPWAPGDTDAPRWWCEACDGEGWSGFRDNYTCEKCDSLEDGTPLGCVSVPPSLAALVAVASRGPETLRGVAELVRELHAVTGSRCETCGGRGGTTITTGDGSHGTLEQERCEACEGKGRVSPVGATLVWRVMTREALEEHHERLYEESWNMNARKRSVAHAFSCETFVRQEHERDPWPETPYTADNDAVRAAWPILRALAIHENGAPTGLHLVAADEKRVVIAVEAL